MPAAIPYIAAFIAKYAVAITIAQVVITIGTIAYTQKQARKDARRATDEYNSKLQDRLVTSITSEAPHRFIIGKCRVGTNIVAMFPDGERDQWQHIVAVISNHQLTSIDEIYINSVRLGPIDEDGFATEPFWRSTNTQDYVYETLTGPTAMLAKPAYQNRVNLHSSVMIEGTIMDTSITFYTEADGRTINNLPTGEVPVSYVQLGNRKYVRVVKHLGYPGEPADATLVRDMPSKWTTEHTLPDMAYLAILVDLNKTELQDGVPTIQVDATGMAMRDVRTGVVAYNTNVVNALHWYLTSELCGVPEEVLPVSKYITAANVCDEPVWNIWNPDTQLFNGARYTFNGVITSDMTQTQVLEMMATAMAGGIDGTSWDVYAGKYVAPIRDFVQEDIIGGCTIVGATNHSDKFNGVTGQFSSPYNLYIPTDFTPYRNPTYRAADGYDINHDLDFPFTDTYVRVHNICRILTERNRNGRIVTVEASVKAWDLSIGDRITWTSVFWGWTDQVFIVDDVKIKDGNAVELLLQEDAPSIWDEADSMVIDAIVNTDLPNPFKMEPLTNLVCTSGTDDLQRLSDGTVISRIRVVWPQTTIAAVKQSGYIEIQWSRTSSMVIWQTMQVPGNETSVLLGPVEDQVQYVIRARAVNATLNLKSEYIYEYHIAQGKTAPPRDVTQFTIQGNFLSWIGISDLDLAGYRIKYHYGQNANWADGNPLHSGLIQDNPYESTALPQGPITLMIKAVDTSGNESLNAATIGTQFGDALVANVVEEFDFAALDYPGTSTSSLHSGRIGIDYIIGETDIPASIESEFGELRAVSRIAFYKASDDTAFFEALDEPEFYNDLYGNLSYETNEVSIFGADTASKMTLLYDIEGESYSIEYRYSGRGPMFPGESGDVFYGEDDDLFFGQAGEYESWPGQIVAEDVQYQFRVRISGGRVQPIIKAFSCVVDVPDITEMFNDVVLPAIGARLPLTKTFRRIRNVQVTLQSIGTGALIVEVIDKNHLFGPLLRARNVNGIAVSGSIDAVIQGY